MQVIIDEIINNVRAVDRQSGLSPEAMAKIISACLGAVRDMLAKDARLKEEQAVDGPWALHAHEDR